MQMASVRQILLPGTIELCLPSLVLVGLPPSQSKKIAMLPLMNPDKGQ